jgi:hypothetical protein
VNFRFPIDPRGSRVVRNKTFLNSKVQGRIFDGFGDEVSNVINRVFSKRFISQGREKIKKLRFIVRGIHDNYSISFIFF